MEIIIVYQKFKYTLEHKKTALLDRVEQRYILWNTLPNLELIRVFFFAAIC